MCTSTFRRPRCAIPITTSWAPASAASSIDSSSIGIIASRPSSENCFWPRNARRRYCSNPSARASEPSRRTRSSRRERLPVAARLDRLPKPDALGVVGEVLDLVGHRAAVDLAEVRQRLLQRLAGDVDAEQRGRDALLQLRRQRRDQARLVERRIAERLGAERVEAGGEVAVHAVRLDERHRRGDGAEQRLVDPCRLRAAPALRVRAPERTERRPRPSGRWRRCRARASPAAAAVPDATRRARCRRSRTARATRAAPHPDSRGSPRAAAARSRRSARRRRARSPLVEGILGDDRDRHPDRPADHAGDHGDRRRSAGCGRTSGPRSARSGPRPGRSGPGARPARSRSRRSRSSRGSPRPCRRSTSDVRRLLSYELTAPAYRERGATRPGLPTRPPPRGTGTAAATALEPLPTPAAVGLRAEAATRASRLPRAAPARPGPPTRRPSRDRRPGSSGSRA